MLTKITYYNIGMAVSDKFVIFKYVLGNKQGKYVIRLKRVQIWRSHPMFKAYIEYFGYGYWLYTHIIPNTQ